MSGKVCGRKRSWPDFRSFCNVPGKTKDNNEEHPSGQNVSRTRFAMLTCLLQGRQPALNSWVLLLTVCP
jgi:hypothetical protein